MRYIHDPEGVEVSHLISACQPRGKKILEIGCGHGTLTFQYAGLPRLSPMALPLRKAQDRSARRGLAAATRIVSIGVCVVAGRILTMRVSGSIPTFFGRLVAGLPGSIPVSAKATFRQKGW